MRLLVLQHVPFEGPAAIALWAKQRGHLLDYLDCSQSPDYPAVSNFDALIIMGGPMGVNDALPWMTAELAFIKQAIEAKKILLGVCLGAQLIASALGAVVRKNNQREIGWFPIYKTVQAHDETHNNPRLHELPETLIPLHWHRETFDLPEKAIHLYRSDACEHQAFLLDDRIIGLQFHLEFDESTVRRVANACENELAEGGDYVQSLEDIVSQPQRFSNAHELLFNLLDQLFCKKSI